MRTRAALVVALSMLLAGCSGDDTPAASGSDDWQIETVAEGLDHPWGLSVLPDGDLLLTERPGRISLLSDGEVSEVDADLDDVYAQGEGGLMGLELSPAFEQDSTFYVCTATTHGDVQIIPFVLAGDRASAERGEPLVTGITLNQSGRHSGCRLRIGPDGMLYAGVGDSAVGTNPQDLTALGGKVLRIDPATGQAPPDNPFAASSDPQTRLIYTLGHRNVQGIAVQPGTGDLYAAEHGPDVDDEVNLLEPGANYGWNPVGSGIYDESVPMTDESIDGAVPAVWSSGDPTIATSGCAFLTGEQWGDREGALAIAALKGSALYLLTLAEDGGSPELTKIPAFDGEFGRLRTVEPGGDGVLFVTTSNGGDDKILKITA